MACSNSANQSHLNLNPVVFFPFWYVRAMAIAFLGMLWPFTMRAVNTNLSIFIICFTHEIITRQTKSSPQIMDMYHTFQRPCFT